MECRDHEVPRWVYDRWGNHPPHDLYWHGKRPEVTKQWVLECRTKWFDDEWSKWKTDYSTDKDPCEFDWKHALWLVRNARSRHDRHDDNIRFEYRIVLRDKT